MTYQVEFSRQTLRQLEALPQQVQQRIVSRTESLAVDPRPTGVKKLKGAESQYRLRVGDYRIVYEIQDAILLIILLRIGHRSNVYR